MPLLHTSFPVIFFATPVQLLPLIMKYKHKVGDTRKKVRGPEFLEAIRGHESGR